MGGNKHWTTRSIEDLRYSVGADFLLQVVKSMESRGMRQDDIAIALQVSKSAVSQWLDEQANNNFTLETILKISAAVGKKATVVLYDDVRESGAPIQAEVFERCWRELDCPQDFWSLRPKDKKK